MHASGGSRALWICRRKNKKADVVKRLQAFDHVGLLRNEPPGVAELLFI